MTVSEPDIEKKAAASVEPTSDGSTPPYEDVVPGEQNELKRSLKNRHMQMIAIGMHSCVPSI